MIKIIPIIVAISFASTADSVVTGRGAISFSNPGRSSFGQISSISRPNVSISRSSSKSSSSISYTDKDYFYCDNYGPFSADDPGPVDVTFRYGYVSIPSQTIMERIRTFKNNKVVSSSSKPSFSYTSGQIREVTFAFNARDYINENGIELRFEIVDASYQVLKVQSAHLYPPSKSHLFAAELKRTPYVSKPLGFYGDGEKMCEIKEEIDFTRIGDYIDNDYYYRLDIGRNVFYSTRNTQITCSSVALKFYDFEYAFPYFAHEESSLINIPLKLVQKDDQVSFQFVNRFYVDEKTLEVSNSYRPNFKVTSSFYLPINRLNQFNRKTIYLEIEELGMDKISTNITLRYELNRLFIGSCDSGEYCIHGGTY